MSSLTTNKIILSSEIENILNRIVNCTKNSYQLVRRAKIILEAANGFTNSYISRKWDFSRSRVIYWRNQWKENYPLLQQAVEDNLSSEKIQSIMISIFSDQQRSGRPNIYTPEQIVQIVSVACEEPCNCDRPISHWSRRELTQEVIKRGIVENISPRTVGRFLKRSPITTPSLSILVKSK